MAGRDVPPGARVWGASTLPAQHALQQPRSLHQRWASSWRGAEERGESGTRKVPSVSRDGPEEAMERCRNEQEELCFPMDDFTSHIQTFYKVNPPQNSSRSSFAGTYCVPAAHFLGACFSPWPYCIFTPATAASVLDHELGSVRRGL